MHIIIGIYTVYRLLVHKTEAQSVRTYRKAVKFSDQLVFRSLYPLTLIMQFVCSRVSSGCEKRNTGLTLFQYGLVQWWACFDGWEWMTLVSGLQLFNLWRIISWRRLLLLALGGRESNRCSTKRYLFIHLVAVVAITAGKKRILFMHYNAMWNTTVACKLYVVGLAMKTTFLCELCGFWNTQEHQVSLSQALYILDLSSNPPPTHTAMCVGMECQAGVSLTAAVTM